LIKSDKGSIVMQDIADNRYLIAKSYIWQ